MIRLLISLIPIALGLALSPIPIIAVILMLFSRRAKVNAPMYAATWVLSMVVIGSLAIFLLGDNEFVEHDTTKTGGSILVLIIGALFMAYGLFLWIRRPRHPENVKTPRWLEALDDIPPILAVGLGLTGVLLNTKNLPLFLAAIEHILAADLSMVLSFIALGIFIAMASVTVVTPIVLFMAGNERMHARLDAFRVWLTHYNQAILAWVFLIMGGVMVLDNVAALFGF